MKRIITFSFLVISVFIVYGAIQCDSLKVYFSLNKATYDTTLNNNASSMKKFIDAITVAKKTGNIDHIAVNGYSSPEGPRRNNDRLALQRSQVIANYISRETGIPADVIRITPECLTWEGLRALVIENEQAPQREAIIRILDEILKDSADSADSDKCVKALIAIDNGITYKWIRENLFPQMRFTMATFGYHVSDIPAVTPVHLENMELTSPFAGNKWTSEAIKAPSIDMSTTLSRQPLHKLALKTNLLYDAALFPNLEIEWLINQKWSVSLEGGIAWWGKYSENKSYRLVMFSPEVRRWVYTRAPWHGLYVGLFVAGGYYDFEKKTDKGYHGEGGMGGLSAGYMWPIGRNLSLEAEIGAGYLYTRYKEYRPHQGHHVYQRTKNLNYFGPLKVKFSFVWRLWNVNKPVRLNFQRWEDTEI